MIDGRNSAKTADSRLRVHPSKSPNAHCVVRGQDGMQRWVGFGVIADNLINIGRALGPSADG